MARYDIVPKDYLACVDSIQTLVNDVPMDSDTLGSDAKKSVCSQITCVERKFSPTGLNHQK